MSFWRDQRNTVVHWPGKVKEAKKIVISEAHTSTVVLATSTAEVEAGEDDEHVSDSDQNSNELDRNDAQEPETDTSAAPEHQDSGSAMLVPHDDDDDMYYNSDEQPLNQVLPPIENTALGTGAASLPSAQATAASILDSCMPFPHNLDAPMPLELPQVPILGPSGRPERRTFHSRFNLAELEKCTCGKDAEVHPDGGTIQCKNTKCVIKWYHLDCVGLDIALRGWMCETCISDGAGRVAKRHIDHYIMLTMEVFIVTKLTKGMLRRVLPIICSWAGMSLTKHVTINGGQFFQVTGNMYMNSISQGHPLESILEWEGYLIINAGTFVDVAGGVYIGDRDEYALQFSHGHNGCTLVENLV
ncbi:hypothetical protein BDZ97DRAFT_1765563 [Flammula alnicola]|nr:hypothetical protein BDZ97DRAFT_1765563 [Flammula alnicola]